MKTCSEAQSLRSLLPSWTAKSLALLERPTTAKDGGWYP